LPDNLFGIFRAFKSSIGQSIRGQKVSMPYPWEKMEENIPKAKEVIKRDLGTDILEEHQRSLRSVSSTPDRSVSVAKGKILNRQNVVVIGSIAAVGALVIGASNLWMQRVVSQRAELSIAAEECLYFVDDFNYTMTIIVSGRLANQGGSITNIRRLECVGYFRSADGYETPTSFLLDGTRVVSLEKRSLGPGEISSFHIFGRIVLGEGIPLLYGNLSITPQDREALKFENFEEFTIVVDHDDDWGRLTYSKNISKESFIRPIEIEP